MATRGARRNVSHVQAVERIQTSFRNSRYVPVCIAWILKPHNDIEKSSSTSESVARLPTMTRLQEPRVDLRDLVYQIAFTPRQNIEEIVDLSCEFLHCISQRPDKLPRAVIFELRECFNALSSVLPEDESIVQLKAMFLSYIVYPILAAPWDHGAIADPTIKSDAAAKSTLTFAADSVKNISDGSILISDTIKLSTELGKKVTLVRGEFRDWLKRFCIPAASGKGGEVTALILAREPFVAENTEASSFAGSMAVHTTNDTNIRDLRNFSGSSSDVYESNEYQARSGALRPPGETDTESLGTTSTLLSMFSTTDSSDDIDLFSIKRKQDQVRESRRAIPRVDSDSRGYGSSMNVEYDSDDNLHLTSSESVGNMKRRSQIRPAFANTLTAVVEESPEPFSSVTMDTESTSVRLSRLRASKAASSIIDMSEFPSRSSKSPVTPPVRSESKIMHPDARGSASATTTTSSIERKATLLSTASGSSADFSDLIIARKMISSASNRRIKRVKSEERLSINEMHEAELNLNDESDEEPIMPQKLLMLSPRSRLGGISGSLTNLTPRFTPSDEFTQETLPSSAASIELWMSPNQTTKLVDLIPNARYTVLLALRSFGCVMCRRMVSHFTAWSKVMQSINAQVICVSNGDFESVQKFRSVTGFHGTILVDQKSQGKIFVELGCMRGWKRALFNMKTLREMTKAISAGYKPGGHHGDKKQLGGVFVIDRRSNMLMKHHETFAGDLVHPTQVLQACSIDTAAVAHLIPADDSVEDSSEVSVKFS